MKVYVDPVELEIFALDLKIFVQQKEAEIQLLIRQLDRIFKTCKDNDFARFEQDVRGEFRYLKKNYLAEIHQYHSFLLRKAHSIREYLKIENSLSKLNDKIASTQKNEKHKIMNIRPIANFINNLDSIENYQKNLFKGDKLKSLLNDKLREIGFTLVPLQDDWDFKLENTFYIKRHSIKNESGIEKVRLKIGKKPDGKHYFLIDTQNNQLFFTKYNRISVPGKLNKNLEKALGKQRPENHVGHHLIPDAIAKNHPFIRALSKMKLFDIDHALNGIFLPKDQEAKDNCPESKNLPIHKGPHPEWNVFVMKLLDNKQGELKKKYKKKISEIDPSILSKALRGIEETLINKINNNEWEDDWK